MSRMVIFTGVFRKAAMLLLLCGVGCAPAAEGISRFAVEGEVTFQGQPVENGSISFEPDLSLGNKGPASNAFIQAGKYTIPETRGVVGGPYIVRLSGYGPASKNSGADMDLGEPLFENYEVRVVLPADSSNQDFQLPDKDE